MSYRSEEAVVQVVVLVASATASKSLGGQGTVGVAGAVRLTTGAVDVELAGRRDSCGSRGRACSSVNRW